MSALNSLSAGILFTGLLILIASVFASAARVRVPLLVYLATPLFGVFAADIIAIKYANEALLTAEQVSTTVRAFAVLAPLESATHGQSSALIVFGILAMTSAWGIALSTALSVRRGGRFTPVRSLIIILITSGMFLVLWLLTTTNPLSFGAALIPLSLVTPTLILSSYDSQHPTGSSRCAAATFSASILSIIGGAAILLSVLLKIETSTIASHLLNAPERVLASNEAAELALDAQSALLYFLVSSLLLIAVATTRFPKATSVRTTFSSLAALLAMSLVILLHLFSSSLLDPVNEIIASTRTLGKLKNPSSLPYSVTSSGQIAGSAAIGDILLEKRAEGWTRSILHNYSTLSPPKFIVAAPGEMGLTYLLNQPPISPLHSFTALTSSDHIRPMLFGVEILIAPESDPMQQPLWVSQTKNGIGLFIKDKYIGDIHDQWINTRFRLARQKTNAESIRFVINDDWSLAELIGTCLTVKKFVATDIDLTCEISIGR